LSSTLQKVPAVGTFGTEPPLEADASKDNTQYLLFSSKQFLFDLPSFQSLTEVTSEAVIEDSSSFNRIDTTPFGGTSFSFRRDYMVDQEGFED